MTRAIEVRLTIPDNEALTALATLQRLGLEIGNLERAEVYRFEGAGSDDFALRTLRGAESIFNPNKHELFVRADAAPSAGEVWVDELPSGTPLALASGHHLAGLGPVERFVAWRLFDAAGAPADEAAVERATETLLCNSAFQRAIR